MFSNPKQVLPALLLSLLIHALVYYAWPQMQALPLRPILVQGELVAPKVEEPAPLPEPPHQQPAKIEPDSKPNLHKAPEPRPQHKAPAPAPKKAPANGVALPLLPEKANAASAGANDYVVPNVPPLTHEDKLPMASRPGETPLAQYSPISEPSSPSSFSSESDKTAPASANGDDPVDRAVLDEYGRGLRDKAAQFGGYPPLAKQRGWQGTVNVLVRFARSGVACQVSVKDPSGYKMLDEQAVKMVKQACAHDALPNALTHKAFSVVIPVEFKQI